MSHNVEDKIKDFNDLLDTISNITDKRKSLWLQVYENSIADRQNAFQMFMKLVSITDDKSNEHAVHGRTMTAYIEKMSKANDQLLKLAELINNALESSKPKDDVLTPNDIYKQISQK